MTLDGTPPLTELTPAVAQVPAATPVESSLAAVPDPEFGQALALFHGRMFSPRDLWTFFIPGIAGVLAPLLYGVARAAYAYTQYGPVAADAWSQPWYTLAGLGLVCLLLLAILRVYAARPRVGVYAHGFELRPGWGRTRRFAWKDLAGLSYDYTADRLLGLTLRRRTRAWIFPQVGARLPLPTGVENFFGLVEMVQAQLGPRLGPALQNRFTAGDWVYFGPLAVSRAGLRLEPRNRLSDSAAAPVPWSAVKQVEVQAGRLVVELTAGGHYRYPTAQIPNLELLFQILERGIPA